MIKKIIIFVVAVIILTASAYPTKAIRAECDPCLLSSIIWLPVVK